MLFRQSESVPFSQWLTGEWIFATFSSHKFHGPRGTGFIYWKKGRRLAPLLTGGGQERNPAKWTGKMFQVLWL